MDIVAVRKDSNGTITNYKLSSGKVISVSEAVSMASSGQLAGYNVSTATDGTKSIRSNPDNSKNNNLDSKPTF